MSCTSEKEPVSDLSSIPPEIQEIENLTIIDNEPEFKVTFADSQRYGEIYIPSLPPAPVLAYGAQNVVDGTGHVFRYDQNDVVIKKYSPSGELVGTIGREGRGPGEFVRIAALQVYDEQLKVYDADLMRISFFDIESREQVRSFLLEYESWDIEGAKYLFPRTFTMIGNQRYLVSVQTEKEEGERYSAYYLVNEVNEIISEKIVETQNKTTHIGNTKAGYRAGITLPFSDRGEIVMSNSGHIYHMNTGEFLIRKYNIEGELEKAFYMPFEKDPLEEQEVLDQYHPNMHPVFDDVEYPETWPAIEQILIDDENRMWVAAIVNDKTIHQWFIIDETSGDLLATFDWPRSKKVFAIQNGKLYAEMNDPEAGAKVVVGYTSDFISRE